MPSEVVTTQYSPSLSPLLAPVLRSMRAPSSSRPCHLPFASTISSVDSPLSDRTALSVRQQRSPLPAPALAPLPPSFLQALYLRSTNPAGVNSNPSPAHEGWLFEAAIRPSTPAEEYPSVRLGPEPSRAGGVPSVYDHENPPALSPASQVDDGLSVLAPKSPVLPDDCAASARSVDVVVSTSAETTPARTLLLDGSGVTPGSVTIRSRAAQSPP